VICSLHNHAFRLVDGQRTTGESPVRAYRVSVDNGELVLQL
jgi:nitrite reductase/ring-hydroxylating ferredoxin subunit